MPWDLPGRQADPARWNLDPKKGWVPPGVSADKSRLQYTLPHGLSPSQIPDWHMLMSPPGAAAPRGALNYTPKSGVSPTGVQAPVGKTNFSMLPVRAAAPTPPGLSPSSGGVGAGQADDGSDTPWWDDPSLGGSGGSPDAQPTDASAPADNGGGNPGVVEGPPSPPGSTIDNSRTSTTTRSTTDPYGGTTSSTSTTTTLDPAKPHQMKFGPNGEAYVTDDNGQWVRAPSLDDPRQANKTDALKPHNNPDGTVTWYNSQGPSFTTGDPKQAKQSNPNVQKVTAIGPDGQPHDYIAVTGPDGQTNFQDAGVAASTTGAAASPWRVVTDSKTGAQSMYNETTGEIKPLSSAAPQTTYLSPGQSMVTIDPATGKATPDYTAPNAPIIQQVGNQLLQINPDTGETKVLTTVPDQMNIQSTTGPGGEQTVFGVDPYTGKTTSLYHQTGGPYEVGHEIYYPSDWSGNETSYDIGSHKASTSYHQGTPWTPPAGMGTYQAPQAPAPAPSAPPPASNVPAFNSAPLLPAGAAGTDQDPGIEGGVAPGSMPIVTPDGQDISTQGRASSTDWLFNSPTSPIANPSNTDTGSGQDDGPTDPQELSMFNYTNRDRANQNLPALGWSPATAGFAQQRAEQALGGPHNGNAHYDPQGNLYLLDYMNQLSRSGRPAPSFMGENLAWTPPNTPTDQVQTALMASPTHRQNILGSQYANMSIGKSADGAGNTDYSEEFGSGQGEPPSGPTPPMGAAPPMGKPPMPGMPPRPPMGMPPGAPPPGGAPGLDPNKVVDLLSQLVKGVNKTYPMVSHKKKDAQASPPQGAPPMPPPQGGMPMPPPNGMPTPGGMPGGMPTPGGMPSPGGMPPTGMGQDGPNVVDMQQNAHGIWTPPIDPHKVVGTGHKFGEPVSIEGVHKGVDLQAYRGTPAKSPVDGTVVRVDNNPRGLGITVTIRDAQGHEHTLGHLGSVLVQRGDRVRAGQPVAHVGSTGASTGPHLDVREKDARGRPVDVTPKLGPLAQMPRADNGSEPQRPGEGQDTIQGSFRRVWNPPFGAGQDVGVGGVYVREPDGSMHWDETKADPNPNGGSVVDSSGNVVPGANRQSGPTGPGGTGPAGSQARAAHVSELNANPSFRSGTSGLLSMWSNPSQGNAGGNGLMSGFNANGSSATPKAGLLGSLPTLRSQNPSTDPGAALDNPWLYSTTGALTGTGQDLGVGALDPNTVTNPAPNFSISAPSGGTGGMDPYDAMYIDYLFQQLQAQSQNGAQQLQGQIDAENNRHQEAMASATTSQEQEQENARHDQSMEQFQIQSANLGIAGQFGLQSQAFNQNVATSALQNPWLQKLTGMLPGYGQPGGPGGRSWTPPVGGPSLYQSIVNAATNPNMPQIAGGAPLTTNPALSGQQQFPASSGGYGSTAYPTTQPQDPNSGVMSNQPGMVTPYLQSAGINSSPAGGQNFSAMNPTMGPSSSSSQQSSPYISYQDFSNWTPFQQAAWQTALQAQGPGAFANEQNNLLSAWGQQGITSPSDTTQLSWDSSGPMGQMQKSNQAQFFGQDPSSWLGGQQSNWQKGKQAQVSISG